MSRNILTVAAVLAASIWPPISGFAEGIKMPQPIISAEIRVPFLHGLGFGQSGSQTEIASLERANERLNSPPLTLASA